jgi:hypothetical protein
MQKKKSFIPAQRDAKGELHFWSPYKKGCVVVDYNQALLEMQRKYGRPLLEAVKASAPVAQEEND